MERWAPQKKDTMEALANEILHNYAHGRVIVGVDGRSGSGAAGFADDLAVALKETGHQAFRASLDGFRHPRERRARGLFSDGFDYSLFRRVLVDPFRTAGSTGFVLAGFDAERDEPVFQPKWQSAGHDAILIVDGVFLHRPELRGIWNYSAWVETPAATGDEADAAYIAAETPSVLATAIYDNTDPEHPRRIFADSC
ncbi:uridine kinase [Homoserinimonas aerilata]|uniref:Uridine kinase n=1 Tax=Homoserinimonas aerilata TaxID=1162970 RepID=A0A542YK26_9MICO|nr:uridine kinase [Homoserinimonas aerilata]TQL48458.1 uridine kinase [Homoserinimonas aerilata]